MKPMFSFENQKIIEKGIEHISKQAAAGETVNQAYFDFCKSSHLSPQMAALLGRVYNTDLAAVQREAPTLLDKLASVELIDIDSHYEKLFGKEFKAHKKAEAVDAMYLAPPKKEVTEKCASVRKVAKKLAPRLDDQPVEVSLEYRKYQVKKNAEAKLERLEFQRREAEMDLNAWVGIYDKYMTSGQYKVAEVRLGIKKLFGDDADIFLEPYPVFKEKTAELLPVNVSKPLLTDAPYKYIDRIGHLTRTISRIDSDKEALFRDFEKQLREIDGRTDNFVFDTSIFNYDNGEFHKKSEDLEKAALGIDDIINLMNKDKKPEKRPADKLLKALTEPLHQDKIKSISASVLLSDLLANDEVLSGYDPEEVTRGFNEVVKTYPYLQDRPGLLRSVLRSHAAQGFNLGATEWEPLSTVYKNLNAPASK